jgi:isopentenyl-diphosphate delta-isomerase
VPTTELVVLLDDEGRTTGTADKAEVHGPDTPLHLAFSAYLFDPAGRLLVTRRALKSAPSPACGPIRYAATPLPARRSLTLCTAGLGASSASR